MDSLNLFFKLQTFEFEILVNYFELKMKDFFVTSGHLLRDRRRICGHFAVNCHNPRFSVQLFTRIVSFWK